MVYSFARVGAALAMRVEDVYTERRRLWVRLREKGGKAHVMPCHHNLENYLTAYIEKTGIADDPKGPLFRTIGRRTKKLSRTALSQPDAYRMIERRTEAAGIETKTAITVSVLPELPLISRAAARSKKPPPWQIMPARARPSSTTGVQMK